MIKIHENDLIIYYIDGDCIIEYTKDDGMNYIYLISSYLKNIDFLYGDEESKDIIKRYIENIIFL